MVSFLPDSLKYRQMIHKATSDDEVPSPGYVAEELKQLSNDADACQKIQDALLSRLETKSSNVKLKGLRLLKLLCERGSPNFKRDLARRTHVVRDCMHWRGDPHPTMGDLPNKMVREAAQEAINAIFDTETRQQPSHQAPAAAVASSSSSSSYAPPSSSQRSSAPPPPEKKRYDGFGRDSVGVSSDVAPERSILSYASNKPPSYSSSSGGGDARSGGFGTISGNGSAAAPGDQAYSVYQVGAKATSMLSSGLTTLKDKVGVGAAQKGYGTSGQIYKEGGGSGGFDSPSGGSRGSEPVQGVAVWNAGSASTSGRPASPEVEIPPEVLMALAASQAEYEASRQRNPPPPPAVNVTPGSWEEGLVEKITQPGGVRAVPGREELKQLANALTTSNDKGALLLGLLISKLCAPQWQARLKALHAFHAMLRSPDSAVQDMIRTFLKNQIGAVKELATSPHASLADLAIKIVDEVNQKPASAVPAQHRATGHSSGADLIDAGGGGGLGAGFSRA